MNRNKMEAIVRGISVLILAFIFCMMALFYMDYDSQTMAEQPQTISKEVEEP